MYLTTTTPSGVTPEIKRLCARLAPHETPVRVPVAPEDTSQPNQCYYNVRDKVAAEGGSAVHGWLIWECSGLFVEAEFHAVWRNSSGELVDVTPKPDGEREILFLPDPVRVWVGIPVKNERTPIQATPLVNRFIKLADARDQEYSRLYPTGLAAPSFKELVRATHFALTLAAANGTMNSPCPCGSGEKFKRCHGTC